MKTTVKLLGTLIIGIILVTSACKKDTDPADRDLFVGEYTGTITYNDGNKSIKDADGVVTVSKVGNLYRFMFGSSIPDLGGIRIEKHDNTFIGVSDDGITGITIDASTLKMRVVRDRQSWTADCTR